MTQIEIDKFCNDYGFKPRNSKSEMKELINLLFTDEKLHGLLEGLLENIGGGKINGSGLVIATNKRIVFFRKSFIGTISKEEVSLQVISSASFRKGLITSSIVVTSSSNNAIVKYCDHTMAQKFVNVLTNLIHDSHTLSNQSTNHSDQDFTQQLEKIYALKEKGAISEDEYISMKSKILTSI